MRVDAVQRLAGARAPGRRCGGAGVDARRRPRLTVCAHLGRRAPGGRQLADGRSSASNTDSAGPGWAGSATCSQAARPSTDSGVARAAGRLRLAGDAVEDDAAGGRRERRAVAALAAEQVAAGTVAAVGHRTAGRAQAAQAFGQVERARRRCSCRCRRRRAVSRACCSSSPASPSALSVSFMALRLASSARWLRHRCARPPPARARRRRPRPGRRWRAARACRWSAAPAPRSAACWRRCRLASAASKADGGGDAHDHAGSCQRPAAACSSVSNSDCATCSTLAAAW